MISKREVASMNQLFLILVILAATLFGTTAEKLWSLKMVGKNIDPLVAIGDVDQDGIIWI